MMENSTTMVYGEGEGSTTNMTAREPGWTLTSTIYNYKYISFLCNTTVKKGKFFGVGWKEHLLSSHFLPKCSFPHIFNHFILIHCRFLTETNKLRMLSGKEYQFLPCCPCTSPPPACAGSFLICMGFLLACVGFLPTWLDCFPVCM